MQNDEPLTMHLSSAILLHDIAPGDVRHILAAGRRQTVEQGRYIYKQGENHQHFYIVAEGKVELTMNIEGSNGHHLVCHIGPGGHFGETSLLTDSRNGLNARALSRLSLLAFDAEAFHRVLLANKVIERRLAIALAKRLQISFQDHAATLSKTPGTDKDGSHNLDPTFFTEPGSPLMTGTPATESDRELRFAESTIARQLNKAVQQFSNTLEPVLLSGEPGTGRRMIASEIHRAGGNKTGPYGEIDVREFDPLQLEVELFGCQAHAQGFPQIAQLGIFEKLQGGTVALYNGEYLPNCQQQLAALLTKNAQDNGEDDNDPSMLCRVILICNESEGEDDANRLIPSLAAVFTANHFRTAPLREHRRDIPRLINYYLKRYCRRYGKTITEVDDQTLGRFINYDWPGNLTEMAGVLQRAVLLGKNHEPLSHQILLGVPKSEGKWEFNLLRLPAVRAFFTDKMFPVLPRAIVGVFFVLVLCILFLGPSSAEENIGMTLSWVVGWPLLIFSFFFLARTWCSVCGLSVPGWLAQLVLKPERPTPQFIKRYSGWIMAFLCILLFWIETAWNAYQSPRLTAWIILTITLGSLFFSMFFKRRVWCRYLCPLGAINSLFSMPSIIELRSNNHMCTNRCIDHSCYNGDDAVAGCPMFRHPFLVDNNRDCILCGQCIKNCKLNSIHLNLRLAPQELWNQQAPRLEDSFLAVSLAAVFYPFAINQQDQRFFQALADHLQATGLPVSIPVLTGLVFVLVISIYYGGYATLSKIMAHATGNSLRTTMAIFGYGMIPLVLGAFMAAHLEILVDGIWLLPKQLADLAGVGYSGAPGRLMSPDTTFVLQFMTIIGGLLASLYATGRIIKRLLQNRPYKGKIFLLPAFLLCLSACAYLFLL